MNIKKLFKNIEEFFTLNDSMKDDKDSKKEKLKNIINKKIVSLKDKRQNADSKNKKKALKKQLNILKGFLKKLRKNE